MEPEIRNFLVLIAQTISLVLLWMMINVLFGIYLGYGYFEGSPSWKNILYYTLFIISLLLIVRHIRKKWR